MSVLEEMNKSNQTPSRSEFNNCFRYLELKLASGGLKIAAPYSTSGVLLLPNNALLLLGNNTMKGWGFCGLASAIGSCCIYPGPGPSYSTGGTAR
jgi:hypothetical protein